MSIIKDLSHYYRHFGWRGIREAVKAKIENSQRLIEAQPTGTLHPFYLRARSSDIYVYGQIFQYSEYAFTSHFSPKIIIDAGANIGLASIYFATKFPEARIISIEPEKENFSLLQKNIAPYENIEAVQAALWNSEESMHVHDEGKGSWSFTVNTNNESETHSEDKEIMGVTIDGIMKKFNFSHIDILKIDIEGAERELFEDPSPWIDHIHSMIIELHENLKPGCSRLFYNATNAFPNEWGRGENIYLCRNDATTGDPLMSPAPQPPMN